MCHGLDFLLKITKPKVCFFNPYNCNTSLIFVNYLSNNIKIIIDLLNKNQTFVFKLSTSLKKSK